MTTNVGPIVTFSPRLVAHIKRTGHRLFTTWSPMKRPAKSALDAASPIESGTLLGLANLMGKPRRSVTQESSVLSRVSRNSFLTQFIQ